MNAVWLGTSSSAVVASIVKQKSCLDNVGNDVEEERTDGETEK